MSAARPPIQPAGVYAVAGALVSSPAILLVLCTQVLPPADPPLPVLSHVALGCSVVALGSSLLIPSMLAFPETLQGFFSKTLICMALNEGAALLACIGLWLGAPAGLPRTLNVAAVVLSFIGLALHFPTPTRLDELARKAQRGDPSAGD